MLPTQNMLRSPTGKSVAVAPVDPFAKGYLSHLLCNEDSPQQAPKYLIFGLRGPFRYFLQSELLVSGRQLATRRIRWRLVLFLQLQPLQGGTSSKPRPTPTEPVVATLNIDNSRYKRLGQVSSRPHRALPRPLYLQ